MMDFKTEKTVAVLSAFLGIAALMLFWFGLRNLAFFLALTTSSMPEWALRRVIGKAEQEPRE